MIPSCWIKRSSGGFVDVGRKEDSPNLHSQEAHLTSQRTGRRASLLTDITSRVGVNIPVTTISILAALNRAVASRRVAASTIKETLLRSGARVPAQGARNGIEPFGVGTGDGGEGVLRGGDGDAVALLELDAALAVKGAVRGGARVSWDGDAEEHRVGEDHGPEGEGVWADGREENGGDVGVDERTAC